MTQWELIKVLQSILENFKPGISLKDAYITMHTSEKETEQMLQNRLRLRKYLRELNSYSSRAIEDVQSMAL